MAGEPAHSWIWVGKVMNSATDTFLLLTALSGAVCMMAWPLFATRSSMLTVQLGIGVSFSIHYALLSAETAAAGNAVGAMQILLALLSSGTTRLRWISYIPIPLMLVLGALTWNGPGSLFATVGTVVLALGRAQLDAGRLRKFVMVGTVFWLVHDLLVWSPIAVIDVISLTVGGLALFRASAGTGRSPISDRTGLHPPLTNPAATAGPHASPSAPLSPPSRLPARIASPVLMSARSYQP